MSATFLHIGQAGCQIGMDLWHLLLNETSMKEDTFFDRSRNKARAILVDSEPKVIRQIQTDSSLQPLFAEKSIVYTQNGRGNNWALGYSATYKEMHKFNEEEDTTLHQRAMEALRHEAEKADFFLGTVITHSLAGGTGSGLGSRLLDDYRDSFNKAYLMTVSVWPSLHGETPLQHYNSCFSLAHIQENADACINFQNDTILKALNKLHLVKEKNEGFTDFDQINMGVKGVKPDGASESSVTMRNLNEFIVSTLKNILQPAQSESFNFMDIMDLCCMPQNKFLQAASNPFLHNGVVITNPPSNDKQFQGAIDGCLEFLSSAQVSKNIEQGIHLANGFQNSTIQHQSILCKAWLKGPDATQTIGNAQQITNTYRNRFVSKHKPVSWNPIEDCVSLRLIDEVPFKNKVYSQKSKPSNAQKNIRGATVLSNNTSIIEPMAHMLNISEQKLRQKAYLHWYTKFGVEEDDFKDKFNKVHQIIDSYTSALYN